MAILTLLIAILFLCPKFKGISLLVLLLLSLLLLFLSQPTMDWFRRRFIPFLVSLSTLTIFSLLFGANLGKMIDIDIRCAGVFFLFSALLLNLPPQQLLFLFSKNGKPSSIALFFHLLYRYISLIREEGERMIRSAKARGGDIKGLFFKAYKLLINYTLRVLARSEMVAMAIEARGWEGLEGAFPSGEEIKVENLSYTYPNGRKALKKINLRIRKGEKVAILGANGAGKSTLLWTIAGFLKPEGKVEIFGIEMRKENLAKLRKIMGIIFEDPDDQLLMPTVFEDVMFGLLNIGYKREEAESLAREILQRFGLGGYEETHPHNLSQGEKRKTCLAGVLAMRPMILLLDEPSANLDGRGKRELMKFLKNFAGTMLLATHDLPFALRLCQRAIVLSAGEIVFDGNIKELLKKKRFLIKCGLL
ncbi:MAG: ATP-binding cassette domain-containing protein [bacterium]